MLTPVTPNPIANATTIKSHGSETRTAPGQNATGTQAQPQPAAHSLGIGLDAGTILANVNAEAATAGNRTILQTLALAVAAQLNISRRNDETMESFFLRIAAALDDMPADERLAAEARAGLKLLKIQIPELSAALKQPESALAARLSATAEAPLATPQKTAAATATTTYLQEAAGVSRAAETLAMVTQVRSNSDGNGLFSSTPSTPDPEKQPSDARSLQTQLKSLFEPGVAETRMEIAKKVEQPLVLILGSDNDELPENRQPTVTESEAGLPQPALVADEDMVGEATAKETKTSDQAVAKQSETRTSEPTQAEARPLNTRQTEARQPDLRQSEVRTTDIRQPDTHQAEAHQLDAHPSDAHQPEARQVEIRTNDPKLATRDGNANASSLPEKFDARPLEPRAEPRMLGLPIAQNNNIPSASMRLRAIAQELVRERLDNSPAPMAREENDDHRMQTMLTLKGIAEVITAMPSKAAEFLMSPQRVADITAKEPKYNGAGTETAAAAPADAEPPVETTTSKAEPVARKDVVEDRRPVASSMQAEEQAEDTRAAASRNVSAEQQTAARAGEPDKAVILRAATVLDPVPFAYAALHPAKETFESVAPEGRARDEDDAENAEDQEREDEETRRKRLARKAVDELLRPEAEVEPELKVTRDSSQADRAYALYQRMAGF